MRACFWRLCWQAAGGSGGGSTGGGVNGGDGDDTYYDDFNEEEGPSGESGSRDALTGEETQFLGGEDGDEYADEEAVE